MTATISYASFWKRLWAYGYDSLIVTIIAMALFFVFSRDALPDTNLDDLNQRLQNWLIYQEDDNVLNQLVAAFNRLAIYITVVSAAYNISFVASRWQATPGKRFCGIGVVHRNGHRLNFWQSTYRHMVSGISMLPYGLGTMSIFFTNQRLALHDIICKTRVIHAICPQ